MMHISTQKITRNRISQVARKSCGIDQRNQDPPLRVLQIRQGVCDYLDKAYDSEPHCCGLPKKALRSDWAPIFGGGHKDKLQL